MLQINIKSVGMIDVNCYILSNTETREAYIVDPGDDVPELIALIEKNQLKPRAILLTHGHVDHIGGVPGMVEKYQIPLWMHPDEKPLYFSPENALMPWMPAVENLPEPVEKMPEIEGITPQVIHTPGHTPGGVCYYYPGEELILTGDTLFKGCYGRTDFRGGSYEAIKESITGKLFPLGDDITVYPGHYGATTIGEEKANHLFD